MPGNLPRIGTTRAYRGLQVFDRRSFSEGSDNTSKGVAAMIVKLGFGNSLLNVFSANGYDVIFKPMYVAIEALTKNEDDLFFNSIAAEVREPAKQIMEIMKNYMQ
jgi:hypothetical protein